MKGGRNKPRNQTRNQSINNLKKKMNDKGFTQRDKKEYKQKVRFSKNVNAVTHRLGITGHKSINEIRNTAFEQQVKKIRSRRAKKPYHKKNIKTRAKEKKDNINKGNEILNKLRTSLRTSLRPIKEFKISLPTPRALSRRTGSRRFVNDVVLTRANRI